MDKYETFSYCGYDCAKCKNFKQNMNCAGCRNENDLISDCPTRICAAERGFLHCGECGEFPCEELKNFYNNGNPMRLQAYHNMLEIIEIGADEWLKRKET